MDKKEFDIVVHGATGFTGRLVIETLLQDHMRRRFGGPASRVHGRVRKMKGTFSGGTAAREPRVMDLLRNPFSPTPGFEGPRQPSGRKPMLDEMLVTGPGHEGRALADAVAADQSMGGEAGPRPGEGPSREEREAGFYDLLFLGENDQGDTLRVSVKGDRDPGYGSTSRMITEAAVCLLQDARDTAGGIWTTAPAMGQRLIDRLQKNAGLAFALEA